MPDTPIYKVFLLNDDYTPMEFVVHVLERIFDLDRKDAEQLMLRVHNDGIAECGAYPREDAESSWQFAPSRKSTGTRCNAL